MVGSVDTFLGRGDPRNRDKVDRGHGCGPMGSPCGTRRAGPQAGPTLFSICYDGNPPILLR
jgi:hypothetical protein